MDLSSRLCSVMVTAGAGEEKCLMERKGGKEEREPEFLVSADLSQRLT